MILLPLGRTDGIGASCFFLNLAGTGLLLDAGTDPRASGTEALPQFDALPAGSYADHALITHAHRDHLGAAPLLPDAFPHVHVHMTPPTRRLAKLLLPASARLQKRKYEEGSADNKPLFTEDKVDQQSALYLAHDLKNPFDVTGMQGARSVEAQFFGAGHILGSAGVLVEVERDGNSSSEDSNPFRLFYTSDTNASGQTILPPASYPEPPLDTLVLECTLGDDPDAAATNRERETDRFAETLAETLRRGGTAVVPVFAMGRAQEILALVGRFKQRGRIPEETPVYTAGMMRGIADIYDETRHASPRRDPDFRVFGVDQESVPRGDKRKAEALDGPGVFVVTSGMMFEPTLSNRLARRVVDNEDDAVLLVGFPGESTPAGRLLDATGNGVSEVTLNAERRGPQPLRCDVERFLLSGHSHREELLQLVDRMQPRQVILVHGNPEARQWMARRLGARHPELPVTLARQGEAVSLED
jgi:Cft2 family RNA processing exonuclease